MADHQKPTVTPAADKTEDVTPEVFAPVEKTLEEKMETGDFTESDADERGWIVFRDTPDDKGVRKETRVPVQHWSRYERTHNL